MTHRAPLIRASINLPCPAAVHCIDPIISAMGRVYDLSDEQIRGKCRQLSFVRARHGTMYLARKLTGMTSYEIGRALNRHHTTVLHGVKSISNQMEIDDDLAALMVLVSVELGRIIEVRAA